jgi:glutaminyl-peptide cyclotransferase
MRTCWLLAIGVAACGGQEELVAPVVEAKVVASFPHDPEAFTQGLAFDRSRQELVEGTGLYGSSTLRRVDLVSGEVLQQVALDETLFGEGVALVGEELVQLTWKAERALLYDAQLELTGERSYPGEGWGLTDDEQGNLVMSDGSSTLRFVDPDDFSERRRVTVRDGETPVELLNELERIDGEIWANVWRTERIARIDPSDGRVVGWVLLDGLQATAERSGNDDVLNGIAFDEATRRIFVTGKRWPVLFEIAVK